MRQTEPRVARTIALCGVGLIATLCVWIALLTWPAPAAAVTLTQQQWTDLVEDAKWIITLTVGIWSSFQILLIIALAKLLWQRTSKNEDKNDEEHKAMGARMSGIEQNLRHRVETLNGIIHSSSELMVRETRVQEANHRALLEQVQELKAIRTEQKAEALERIADISEAMMQYQRIVVDLRDRLRDIENAPKRG